MSRTEPVTLTNMCMVYDGDKVLVQQKVDDDYTGITFPGGHVEKGESFTDAVIREVFEETGLTISAPSCAASRTGQMTMAPGIWCFAIKPTDLPGSSLPPLKAKYPG